MRSFDHDPSHIVKCLELLGEDSCIKALTEREYQIIAYYYGLWNAEKHLTLEEIGARFNLTGERIRQIRNEALQKLSDLPIPIKSYVLEGNIEEV